MRCQVCGTRDGPCGKKDSRKRYFFIRFRSNFIDHLNVPCFARKMFNSSTRFALSVRTNNRELYVFKLRKYHKKTQIFGSNYQNFLSDYNMNHGDQIMLDMNNDSENVYIHPLDKHGNEKQRVVEDFVFKDVARTVVFSKGFEPTPSEVARINQAVLSRGSGLGAIFVHVLTNSDILRNCMHIPKFIVSDLKIPSRGISLLVGSEDGVNMEAEYYKSKDKRIRFKSGWKEFAANNNLTAGVAVLIMFHMRRSTVKISFDVIRY